MKSFPEIFSKEKKVLSFEFFPPKKAEKLDSTKSLIRLLSEYNPDFMTVTYGAGGGTRDFTKDLVTYIAQELNKTAVSHLTCVGHQLEEIREIVGRLKADGIRNILALRGDAPVGQAESDKVDSLDCARDLVTFLQEEGGLSLAVAGYPEVHSDAVSQEEDLKYLFSKQEAGATLIITQLFFDSSHYFDFVEKAKNFGITIPIMPGLMPISNVQQVQKFTNMCGATIPADLLSSLKQVETDSVAVGEIGINHTIKQVDELLNGGAPGIHFYTLNKSPQIQDILAKTSRHFN